MVNYIVNGDDSRPFVQVVPQTVLRLVKESNSIQIQERPIHRSESKDWILESRIEGTISASTVQDQLTNIRHIGFEVTDACNLKCTYCAYGKLYNDYDERKGQKMDSARAKRFLDHLLVGISSTANQSAHNKVYISFYGGEPLLNMPFIEEIVHYTQSKQTDELSFHYMMTSNAVYLKKYIPFLVEHDFRVMVSLDGTASHDAYRLFQNGQESFQTVYTNVQYVQTTYPDYFKKNISFNAVLHNLNNRQEILDFFQREFGKQPNLSDLNNSGVNPLYQSEFDTMKQTKPVVEVEQAEDPLMQDRKINALQEFIFQYSGNKYSDYNTLLDSKAENNYIPTATCLPFSKRIFLTVNNKILPCEKIGQQYAMGRMSNDELGLDCEHIASRYNAYYRSLHELCKDCYNKINCPKCMFGIEGLGDANPFCNKKIDKEAFTSRLQEKMNCLRENPELYKKIIETVMVER